MTKVFARKMRRGADTVQVVHINYSGKAYKNLSELNKNKIPVTCTFITPTNTNRCAVRSGNTVYHYIIGPKLILLNRINITRKRQEEQSSIDLFTQVSKCLLYHQLLLNRNYLLYRHHSPDE